MSYNDMFCFGICINLNKIKRWRSFETDTPIATLFNYSFKIDYSL